MWMGHYHHQTPKRTLLVSNSEEIAALKKGPLRKCKKSKVKTAIKYKNRDGKTCYKGTPQLRGTQLLGLYIIVNFVVPFKI